MDQMEGGLFGLILNDVNKENSLGSKVSISVGQKNIP